MKLSSLLHLLLFNETGNFCKPKEENKNSSGLNKDISRIDALWQQGLEKFGGPFLAGDTFTAVDAMYAPVAAKNP